MEALMPGSAGGDVAPAPARPAHRDLDQGPDPRRRLSTSPTAATRSPATASSACAARTKSIEVHVIGCDKLASGVDADWLDLAWGDGSDGGTARLVVILRDVAGALGEMAGILGAKGANIVNLVLAHRDGSFHTFHVDVEVHDLAHLHA